MSTCSWVSRQIFSHSSFTATEEFQCPAWFKCSWDYFCNLHTSGSLRCVRVLRCADAAAPSVGVCEGHSNIYHGSVHEHVLIPSSQGSPVISCPVQLLPLISDPAGLCEAAERGCTTSTPASTTVTCVRAPEFSCSSFNKLVCTEESKVFYLKVRMPWL